MSRLKFRVWRESIGFLYDYIEGESIQRFTGLTDKNGREIYEGDILSSYHEGEEGNPYIPEYTEVGAVYYSDLADFRVNQMPLFGWNDDSEIIGNILENSELLS